MQTAGWAFAWLKNEICTLEKATAAESGGNPPPPPVVVVKFIVIPDPTALEVDRISPGTPSWKSPVPVIGPSISNEPAEPSLPMRNKPVAVTELSMVPYP